MSKERKNLFYGWIITAGTWLIYFLTVGPPGYGTPVITARMVTEYGWTESIVGNVTSCRAISYALTSLLGGFLVKRFGAKNCMIAANSVSIACMLCIFSFDLSETAYALMFLGIGVGYGMMIVGSLVLVNNWFSRNKSLPMSLLLTAGAAGGVLMPIITEFLSKRSIRLCWGVFIGFFVVSILMALFLLKNRPEDIGEVPDGRTWAAAHPLPAETASTSEALNLAEDRFGSMKEVFRSKTFYLVGLIMLILRMTFICFSSYIVLYSVQSGIDSVTAAAILSAYSISSLVARMLCGGVDRLHVSQYFLAVMTLVATAAGFMLLILTHSVIGYVGAALITGFASGFSAPLFPLLLSSVFGSSMFSRVYGILNATSSVGSSITPFIIGAIRSAGGGYDTVYLSFGICAFVVSVLALALRPAKTI